MRLAKNWFMKEVYYAYYKSKNWPIAFWRCIKYVEARDACSFTAGYVV
jgi:hypothetical protein